MIENIIHILIQFLLILFCGSVLAVVLNLIFGSSFAEW